MLEALAGFADNREVLQKDPLGATALADLESIRDNTAPYGQIPRIDALIKTVDVPAEQRGAKFVSAVCFMLPDGRALEVEGECPGRIAFSLQNGDYGFGYDPLFIPDEYGAPDGKHPNAEARSYAQLTPDEKDAISHRGRAMEKLEEKLPEFLK